MQALRVYDERGTARGVAGREGTGGPGRAQAVIDEQVLAGHVRADLGTQHHHGVAHLHGLHGRLSHEPSSARSICCLSSLGSPLLACTALSCSARLVKSRADAFIRAAGSSARDVIRAVWEHIAQMGEVPDASGDVGKQHTKRDSLERPGELRVSFGACDDLVALDDAQMRDMIASRYA